MVTQFGFLNSKPAIRRWPFGASGGSPSCHAASVRGLGDIRASLWNHVGLLYSLEGTSTVTWGQKTGPWWIFGYMDEDNLVLGSGY